jgi:hypothetical protein
MAGLLNKISCIAPVVGVLLIKSDLDVQQTHLRTLPGKLKQSIEKKTAEMKYIHYIIATVIYTIEYFQHRDLYDF